MRILTVLAGTAALAACGEAASNQGQAKAAAAPGATASAQRADPGRRTFRDWLAVCDNVNTCYAFGPAAEGTGWVRISIPAGPEAEPMVMAGFWPENGDFGGPVTARVDGATFAAVADTDPDAAPSARIDPGVTRALVDAMAQGEAMALTAGSETVPLSLSGVAASLLWIDERQGRLGTTTALIRKGERPASAVPTAPGPPRIEAAAAIAQTGYGDQAGQTLPASIEALPAVVQCRADTAFNPDLQKEISSARLNAETVLWSVPCGAGAYNFSSAYFTTDPQGENPRRITFPTVAGEPEELLVNAGYDPVTRVIDAFNKGRGLGDCGMADSWTWTARGFVLRSSSEMPECWGVPSEYWPMSWVSE